LLRKDERPEVRRLADELYPPRLKRVRGPQYDGRHLFASLELTARVIAQDRGLRLPQARRALAEETRLMLIETARMGNRAPSQLAANTNAVLTRWRRARKEHGLDQLSNEDLKKAWLGRT